MSVIVDILSYMVYDRAWRGKMNKWNIKKKILIFLHLALLLIEAILGIIYLITKNDKLFYPMGFCLGLSITFLFTTIVIHFIAKNKSKTSQFDERQLKARGDCFCVSFFVLVGCLLLDGMIRLVIEYDWSSYMVGVFTCCVISIAVFAVLAIWKDAYTTAEESKIWFMCFSFVCGIINFGVSIIEIIRNRILENGKLGLPFMNVLAGGLLLIIGFNLLIKYKLDKRKDFEDEELKTEIC